MTVLQSEEWQTSKTHLDSAFEMHRFACPSGLVLRELVHTGQTLEKHRVNRVPGRFMWKFVQLSFEGWCRMVQKGMWDVIVTIVVGGVSHGPRYLKVRPQNLHPLRHPSDERPRGGVLKEFFEVPDDLVWPPRADICSESYRAMFFAAEVSVKSCTNTVASCSPRSLFEQRLGVASLISDLPSAPCQVKMSINACFARMIWDDTLGRRIDLDVGQEKIDRLVITSLLHNQTSPRHCHS